MDTMNSKTYTYSDDLISDLHKDAHGYRPREHFWSFWAAATDAEKQAEWEDLLVAMDVRNQLYLEEQRLAIIAFEALVTLSLHAGAKDRTMAIQWLMDAAGCTGDYEYFCFQHGLPYTYFRAT